MNKSSLVINAESVKSPLPTEILEHEIVFWGINVMPKWQYMLALKSVLIAFEPHDWLIRELPDPNHHEPSTIRGTHITLWWYMVLSVVLQLLLQLQRTHALPKLMMNVWQLRQKLQHVIETSFVLKHQEVGIYPYFVCIKSLHCLSSGERPALPQ